jgi:hypothetical protein
MIKQTGEGSNNLLICVLKSVLNGGLQPNKAEMPEIPQIRTKKKTASETFCAFSLTSQLRGCESRNGG